MPSCHIWWTWEWECTAQLYIWPYCMSGLLLQMKGGLALQSKYLRSPASLILQSMPSHACLHTYTHTDTALSTVYFPYWNSEMCQGIRVNMGAKQTARGRGVCTEIKWNKTANCSVVKYSRFMQHLCQHMWAFYTGFAYLDEAWAPHTAVSIVASPLLTCRPTGSWGTPPERWLVCRWTKKSKNRQWQRKWQQADNVSKRVH